MLVKISTKLIDDVRGKITRLRDRELDNIGLACNIKSEELDREYIDRLLWGDKVELRSQIPDNWLPKISRLYVDVYQDGGKKHSFNIMFNSEVSAPEFISLSQHRDPIKAKVDDSPVLEAYVRKASLRGECNQRWNQVHKEVISFIGKCKSLNEALKLLPSIKIYIPDEYLKKVETKVVSNKPKVSPAEEALAKVNTDILATNAVLTRMEANRT